MAHNIDDTILNMIKNLKPMTETTRNPYFTPLKRSSSNSSSNDEITPSKRLKQDSKLETSYIGSPREYRRMRADLIEARNTIKTLEGTVNHLHSVRKNMEMMFDEENTILKRQSDYDKKSKEELENQLQVVRKREIAVKSELTEISNKYHQLKIKSNEEVELLKKNFQDLNEETKQNELDESNMVSTLEKKISELENMLEAAEEDAEAQKKLVEDLGKRITEDNAIQIKLELKEKELLKAKLLIKELECTVKNYGEFQEQAKNQVQQLSGYSELQRENEYLKEENLKLKENVRNKLILEEQVHDLTNRLAKFKDYEKKFAEIQIQETQNNLYLNEWRAVARGICESMDCDSALPHQLRDVVEKLQHQELSLTTQKVELESQLRSMTHEYKVAKSEVEKGQKLIIELKQTGEQRQKLIHRMEKRLMLVTRERDSYRLQLDSYEKDLTMYGNTTVNLGSPNQLQSQKEHIDNLEKIVVDYRDLVNKLENDLQNAVPNVSSDAVPMRTEQFARLKDELQLLKLENDKLRERRDQLEIQLEEQLDGHDTLKGGRAFHRANNPLSDYLTERENYIGKLEKDVERLKKKIKNLEDGLEGSKLGDTTLTLKEVNELREQLQSAETQTQMVKDYFKSQMQEFRNIIYMLLGYKIDRSQSSLYKLTSMYAEKPDDSLCFKLEKNGDLNLLENEFSGTLESMIDLHLRHQKSIPVFLSAITMDLFNSKTKSFMLD